jgi:hypothetical protein
MPRPKLNLTEEERKERITEQHRRSALKYYYSKHPRLETDIPEADLEERRRKKEYFQEYYQQHRDKILTKANLYNHTKRGLAQVTTQV